MRERAFPPASSREDEICEWQLLVFTPIRALQLDCSAGSAVCLAVDGDDLSDLDGAIAVDEELVVGDDGVLFDVG